MLSIFHYESASQFLRESWEQKKETNPSFSIRAWAKSLEMSSHSALHKILNGKRSVPRKYIRSFSKSLSLSTREVIYFETLVNLEKAKTLEEKESCHERLKVLYPKTPLKAVEIEAYKCLKDPLHFIILEMTEIKNFELNSRWIKKHLRFKATIKQIEKAIERLLQLELLKEENGVYRKVYSNLTSTHDIDDQSAKYYHKQISELAAEQVFIQAPLEREFNAFCMNMRKEDLKKAKQLIREFADNFIQEIEAPYQEGDDTYQLNLQFFNLTKISKEEK